MHAHPDFAETPFPKQAELGMFRLEIISPSGAHADFTAIDTSREVLDRVFGDDWPSGVDFERNRKDLIRHEREFESRIAFSWFVKSRRGLHLGCAYFRPTPGIRGKGRAAYWIRDRPDRLGLLADLGKVYRAWLDHFLPPEYDLAWYLNDWPNRPKD